MIRIMHEQGWLTRSEAAGRLRIDVATLDRWVVRGTLTRYRMRRRSWFRIEDVDAIRNTRAREVPRPDLQVERSVTAQTSS